MNTPTITRTTYAAAVSAALRRGGLRPLSSGSSRMREGIRVTNGYGRVRVSIDVDRAGARRALAEDAAEILSAAGYGVEPVGADALNVTRARKCKCGEPEDGGEFGWFTTGDVTRCNACGATIK